jgi:hypothetical protein
LATRSNPEVGIAIELSEEFGGPRAWRYELFLQHEGTGKQRVIVAKERVWKGSDQTPCLDRPDIEDKEDTARRTQTALQDERSNSKFRDVAEFLRSITYLHVVPQLIQHADRIGGFKIQFDPFGQELLERIARTPERFRKARLKKIEEGLKTCVPHLTELEFESDPINGKPHIKAKYKHWRPNGGWQREDQFSDGTLRLIGLLWVLLEGGRLLLLEEPELSLNDGIVEQLPRLVRKMQAAARTRSQVVVTTHSESLLAQVDGSEVRRLALSSEGTTIEGASESEIKLLRLGMSPAEVLLPKVRQSVTDLGQVKLF